MKVQKATDQIHHRVVSVALGPGSQPRAVSTTSSQWGRGMSNPSGDIWPCLKIFLFVTTWGSGEVGCYKNLVSDGQGCCYTSCNAQDGFPAPSSEKLAPNVNNAERLRNWALK